MNGLGEIGQWAGTLFAPGWAGRLEYAAVALLVVFAVAVPWHAVAAWRQSRRSGRSNRGPLPRRVPSPAVGYERNVPADGRPLRAAEVQAYARIVHHLKDDGKKRMAAPRRGPAKRMPKSARTGRK